MGMLLFTELFQDGLIGCRGTQSFVVFGVVANTSAAVVGNIDVGAGIDEDLESRRDWIRFDCPKQGSPAFVIPSFEIGASCNEGCHGDVIVIAWIRGTHQCSFTVLISCINVSTGIDEEIDDIGLLDPMQEWRISGRRRWNFGSGIEQELHYLIAGITVASKAKRSLGPSGYGL